MTTLLVLGRATNDRSDPALLLQLLLQFVFAVLHSVHSTQVVHCVKQAFQFPRQSSSHVLPFTETIANKKRKRTRIIDDATLEDSISSAKQLQKKRTMSKLFLYKDQQIIHLGQVF